jgi:hypothetical protein
MTSLRDIQENFQSYMLHEEPIIQTHIAGADSSFKQTRLDVYRLGYSLRLLEALGKGYPTLSGLVGEELFERLGREYIAEYPSNHFSVGCFGRHFSKFLATHHTSDPKLSEIAAFEWAMQDVTEALDAPHITFEDMASIPPESWTQLRLVTHPSVQMLSLFYRNIPLYWQDVNSQKCNKKVDDEESCEQKSSEKIELQRGTESVAWLVWRFNMQSYYVSLSKQQVWMIQAIQSGMTFAEVCEGLCQWLSEEEVTQFAAENLRNWIVEGVFTKVEV